MESQKADCSHLPEGYLPLNKEENMKKFAKLFETDLGQILVFKDASENTIEITFDTQSPDFSTSCIKFTFETENKLEIAFEFLTEEKAYKLAKQGIEEVTGFLAGSEE